MNVFTILLSLFLLNYSCLNTSMEKTFLSLLPKELLAQLNMYVRSSGSDYAFKNINKAVTLVKESSNILGAAEFDYQDKSIATSVGSHIALWNCKTGELLKTLYDHKIKGLISQVQFDLEGKKILVTSDDTIALWDIDLESILYTLKGTRGEFTDHGKRIITYFKKDEEKPTLNIWNSQTGEFIEGFSGELIGAYIYDNRIICRTHNSLQIRDTSTGNLLNTAEMPSPQWCKDMRITSFLLKPHNPIKIIAIPKNERDELIQIWDLEKNTLILKLKDEKDFSNRAAHFNLQGTKIASTSRLRAVKIWDAITGQLMRKIEFGETVNKVQFTALGNKIITRHTNQDAVKIWDSETGKFILELPKEKHLINRDHYIRCDSQDKQICQLRRWFWHSGITQQDVKLYTLINENDTSLNDFLACQDTPQQASLVYTILRNIWNSVSPHNA